MMEFDDYAQSQEQDLDLEFGMSLIARDAYPLLDTTGLISRLNALAAPLLHDSHRPTQPDEFANYISHYLFEKLGFRGNNEHFNDPRNNYLNDVLDRRLGIPISLAIVWLSLARRLGLEAYGVSFPGHFLIRVERAQRGPIFLDPYASGQQLHRSDLIALLHKALGDTAKLQTRHLARASNRTILIRVLHNLKAAHFAQGNIAQALVAATRIATLAPDDPEALRDRGILQAQLGAIDGATDDLSRYVNLAPHAHDVESVLRILNMLSSNHRVVLN